MGFSLFGRFYFYLEIDKLNLIMIFSIWLQQLVLLFPLCFTVIIYEIYDKEIRCI